MTPKEMILKVYPQAICTKGMWGAGIGNWYGVFLNPEDIKPIEFSLSASQAWEFTWDLHSYIRGRVKPLK